MRRSQGLSRRTPLRNRSPLARHTPINPVSVKERARQQSWQKVRKVVITRDEGLCRRCGREVGFSGDVHHLRRRSQGGTDLPDNLVTLCRTCHNRIHEHVAEAVAEGWLIHGEVAA